MSNYFKAYLQTKSKPIFLLHKGDFLSVGNVFLDLSSYMGCTVFNNLWSFQCIICGSFALLNFH